MSKILFTAPVDFDLSVAHLFYHKGARFKHITEFPQLEPDESVKAWVCNPKQHFVIDSNILALFPNLRILATPSTGTNHIDLRDCEQANVNVFSLLDNRKGLESISASAEFTFKLLLDAMRLEPAFELQNKTVGLVGYGRIGRRISKWVRAFGGNCLVYDPYVPGMDTTLRKIFTTCDAVVICCSLTDETRGMIDKSLLEDMPYRSALINTARGEIINEGDLLDVLYRRHDLRVMLDVISGEVDGTADPLHLMLAGAHVTNHIAGETFDSRTKAARIIYYLVERFL